jgi:hypothetical protein
VTPGTKVKIKGGHYKCHAVGRVWGLSTTWNNPDGYLIVEFPDGERAEYHPSNLVFVPPLTQLAMVLDE